MEKWDATVIRRHPLRWLAVAGTTALTLGLVAAYAAQASPSSSPTITGDGLAAVYAHARHLPASTVAVRAGSLHIGSYDGTNYAAESFVPATGDNANAKVGFQDGGSGAVFEQNAEGVWQLLSAGLFGCGSGLPAALAQQWGIAQPAGVCTPSSQAARPAVQGTTLGDKIASIALGEVGVADSPASQFFTLDCDPFSTLVAGFSANSDGCGYNTAFGVEDENETWCSDFAKWVWEQAGITAGMGTINAGADSFYTWGTQQGQTPASDPTNPAVGDAVLFYPAGQANAGIYSDHIGLITAVNSDGTVNIVNGDFGGSPTPITVEYNTEVSLASWAAAIWGSGEQWTFVAPPAGAQQPVPSASMSGPATVTAGTSVNFSASGGEPGGSISSYAWTFGDNRATSVSGAQVSHEWAENGTYPVTVTVTSSDNTETIKTMEVDVTGSSGAEQSAPVNLTWYDPNPIDQYLFQRAAGGGLVADTSDGASWLQMSVPGSPDSASPIANLTYPDPDVANAMVPHAYYTQGGALTETYVNGSYPNTASWTSQTLAGNPETGSALVATTQSAAGTPYADVFFFGAGGALSEATDSSGSWTSSRLGGPATSTPGSLALASTASGPELFYLSDGLLVGLADAGGQWSVVPTVNSYGIAKGSSLTATGSDVFFIDGSGHLAVLSAGGSLFPSARQLPGSPAAGTQLASTSYLPGSSQSTAGGATELGQDVYYLSGSGQPQVDYTTSPAGSWQTASLPGTAASLYGAGSYQVPGQPDDVYLDNGGQLSLDQASSPSGTWSPVSLPSSTATTLAGKILLYAATSADEATALTAAAAAGLPASQVTTSFEAAWDATLSPNYLVISVGAAATDALEFNVCGWANPDEYGAGTTPFTSLPIYPGWTPFPWDTQIGPTYFEAAYGATAAGTVQLADDLTEYAATGQLPSGVTGAGLSGEEAYPQYTCSGSAS
jgi:hypothetical protein